jgi:hypothetical protein
MHKQTLLRYLALLLSTGGALFCSKIGDSTDLGSNILNDISPDKTSIGKHFRAYAMDTSGLEKRSSLPAAGDTGFGLHGAYLSSMVMGIQADDTAVGYVEFAIQPDTTKYPLFSAKDTLIAMKLRFTRDTGNSRHPISVWHSKDRSIALNPSQPNDSLLGSIAFPASGDTLNDTITIVDSALTHAIFSACTTKCISADCQNAAKFGFILKNNDAGLAYLKGDAQILVTYWHNDSASEVNGYTSYGSYKVRDANSGDSAMLSYGPKRTAAFQYNINKLWHTADSGLAPADSIRPEVVSASFSLKNPDSAGDSLNVSAVLWHELVHNGIELDSLFNGHFNGIPSYPVTALLTGTAPVAVDVRSSMREYEQGVPSQKPARASTLYLYVRFVENTNQTWKVSNSWTKSNAPLLSAIVTVP